MSKVHEMILSALNQGAIREILGNDRFQIEYGKAAHDEKKWQALLSVNPMRFDGISEYIISMESVQKLCTKAKKKKTITLGEFEACLADIQRKNDFVGWVLKEGSAEIKSLLRAQSQDPVKSRRAS